MNFLNRNDIKHINSLDALKGIAILGIVLTHSGASNFSGILGEIAGFGAKGVQLFFILSSMLIYRSFDKKFAGEQINIAKCGKWYLSRFVRLIPLYYIANIAVLIKDGMLPSYWSGSKGITAGTIISNFLFLHGFNPWYCNAININWYIGTLAIFILLVPLLYKIINSIDKAVVLLCLSWMGSILCNHTIAMINMGDDNYVWTAYWNIFSIIAQFPILVLGIILYFLYFKTNIVNIIIEYFLNQDKGKKKIINMTYGLLFICLLLLLFMIHHNATFIEYAIVFAFIIFILLLYECKLIVNPILVFLGKYSYGIYLFHYPLMEIWKARMEGILSNETANILGGYFVVLIVSTLLSFILSNIIEKPIIKSFNERIKDV